MSQEASVRQGLQVIRAGTTNYQPPTANFRPTVSTPVKGPTPGFLTVTTTGQNVDLSLLTVPGLYRIQNTDPTNYVEYGIHDGTIFHPWGEVLPGEEYVGRFSRNFGEEATVPGTGTSATVNSLYVRANGASCGVVVDVFEA